MTDLIEHLPCDVLVQPATLIERGCMITTLLECIEMRRERAEKGPPLPDILSRRQAEEISALRERVEAAEALLSELHGYIRMAEKAGCDDLIEDIYGKKFDKRLATFLAQQGGEVG